MQLTAGPRVLLLARHVLPQIFALLSCSLLCSQHEGHSPEIRHWSPFNSLPGTALCLLEGAMGWGVEESLLAGRGLSCISLASAGDCGICGAGRSAAHVCPALMPLLQHAGTALSAGLCFP